MADGNLIEGLETLHSYMVEFMKEINYEEHPFLVHAKLNMTLNCCQFNRDILAALKLGELDAEAYLKVNKLTALIKDLQDDISVRNADLFTQLKDAADQVIKNQKGDK